MRKVWPCLLWHTYVLAIFWSLASSSAVLQNLSSSLLVPSKEATSNSTSILDPSRPGVPFEWPISNSGTKLIVLYYYRLVQIKNVYAIVIEALYDLYLTAIYDHGDLPVRADKYQHQSRGLSLEISRYAEPGTPELYYSTVVRVLWGIQQLFQVYSRMCGISMIVFEHGQKVARAFLKPLGTMNDA